MFTKEDFEQVEEELGVVIPPALQKVLTSPEAYVSYAEIGIEFYLNAKDLIYSNAQVVVSEWFSHTDLDMEEFDDFFLFARDCGGNCYLFDPDDDDSSVWNLVHDPLEMIDTELTIEEFLAEYARNSS